VTSAPIVVERVVDGGTQIVVKEIIVTPDLSSKKKIQAHIEKLKKEIKALEKKLKPKKKKQK
jgi:hypothetical protein